MDVTRQAASGQTPRGQAETGQTAPGHRPAGGAPHRAVRVFELDSATGGATIDEALIDALHGALDAASRAPECRILLLTSATPGVFSVGMNVAAAGRAGGADAVTGAPGTGMDGGDRPTDAGGAGGAGGADGADGVLDEDARRTGGAFFDLLARFTQAPVIVAAAVEGRVAGGGVGLVAACDFVVATEASTFGLPEALWGLLPCCVLPFLIRRVGFQRAHAMALTTRPVAAAEAAAWGLVDETGPDPAAAVRRLALRADKIDTATIAALKAYTNRLWPVTDDVRQLAVDELGRLMALPAVRGRLSAFADGGRYPWER